MINTVSVYPAVGGQSIQHVTQVVRADKPVCKVIHVVEEGVVELPDCDSVVLLTPAELAQLTVRLPALETEGKMLTITATKDIYQLELIEYTTGSVVFTDSMLETSSITLLATHEAGWIRL